MHSSHLFRHGTLNSDRGNPSDSLKTIPRFPVDGLTTLSRHALIGFRQGIDYFRRPPLMIRLSSWFSQGAERLRDRRDFAVRLDLPFEGI